MELFAINGNALGI